MRRHRALGLATSPCARGERSAEELRRGVGGLSPKSSKGHNQPAELSDSLNGLTENRNGLLVGLSLEQATGTAERDAAASMLYWPGGDKRITLGADKGYDTKHFIAECHHLNVPPHVAQNIGKRPATR